MPILYSGYLQKKSEKNIIWIQRFCLITATHFLYYPQEPLPNECASASFALKHIYSLTPFVEANKFTFNKPNII